MTPHEAAHYPRTKHWVIDDLISENAAQAIVAEWPKKGWSARFGPKCSGKFTTTKGLGPLTTGLLTEMNNGIGVLERLTGIDGLVADPTLEGGGLHRTEPGGYLGVHTDFNKLGGLDRRLNLLIFLNPEWHDDWGGEFELWDSAAPVLRVLPTWRKAVLFETSGTSWHACAPVHCPYGYERRSIALYYYTPGDGEKGHGTIYR